MNTTDTKTQIENDPDYVALKRFDYSLETLLARYPDGCPDHVIAQALLVSEEEVEGLYQGVVARMRTLMGVSA